MTLSQITLESSATAARSWKMILLLFVINFLLALILALGFHSQLVAAFGNSMLPERLLTGFSATVYNEVLRVSPHLLIPYWSELFWLLVFSFVLNTLLGGGIIRGLSRGAGSFSLADFFADCGVYFLRLLGLLVICGVALFLLGFIWFFICGLIYGFLTSGATTETPYVSSLIIAGVIFLVPMVTLLMIADYAKIALVLENNPSPFHALLNGTKFVLRHFLSTTVWQWMMIVSALLLILLYWIVEGNLAMATGFGVFIVFLLQQLSIGGRIWVKLTTIGGQTLLFQRTEAAPAVAGGFVPPVVEPLPPVPTGPVKTAAPRRGRTAKAPRRRVTPRKRKR